MVYVLVVLIDDASLLYLVLKLMKMYDVPIVFEVRVEVEVISFVKMYDVY
jgi:hypothetical protein